MTRLMAPMSAQQRLALIAHDNCKGELLEWARLNQGTLIQHELYATGALLANELELPVARFLSGPLGGDQPVGAAIVEGRVDLVIFCWDPLEPQPHDVEVKALLRDLRNMLRLNGWADVLMLGFDAGAVSRLTPTDQSRTMAEIRFVKYGAATRVSVERLSAGVNAAVLRSPLARFPEYKVVNLAEWLEGH